MWDQIWLLLLFRKQQQHVTVLNVWRNTDLSKLLPSVWLYIEEAGVTHDSPSTGDHQFDFDPIGHQDTQNFLITHILHTAVKHTNRISQTALYPTKNSTQNLLFWKKEIPCLYIYEQLQRHLEWTDELYTKRPGRCIKKVNRVNFDFIYTTVKRFGVSKDFFFFFFWN